jgi:hypothetical protein
VHVVRLEMNAEFGHQQLMTARHLVEYRVPVV